MKKNNLGFMLAETLLVTVFVAGVLIYLFMQFYNLSNEYSESYKYNSVEGLYALEDVVELIQDDTFALSYINENISSLRHIDISNCTLFTDSSNCKKLLELENINEIFVTTNILPNTYISDYSNGLNRFISRINPSGTEPYRLVASFKNGSYATLRFKNTMYEGPIVPIDEDKVIVTFDPNGGNVSTLNKEIYYGSTYGTLPTPSKSGNVFVGWYGDRIYPRDYVSYLTQYNTVRISPGSSYSAPSPGLFEVGDILEFEVLTPGVTINSIDINNKSVNANLYTKSNDTVKGKIELTSSMMNGTNNGTTSYQFLDINCSSACDNYIIKEFRLVKKAVDKVVSTTVVSRNEDHTLKAKWTPTRTLTLYPNDGSNTSTTKNVGYDVKYGTLATPTRIGYKFDGWYNNIVKAAIFENNKKVSSTGALTNNNEYIASSELIPVTGGVTLYSNMEISGIYSFDASGNFIRRESTNATTHQISSNAAYIRIEINKDSNDYNYYMNNLIINELQNEETLEYVNKKITSSVINKIDMNHNLYAKWLPEGGTLVNNEHVIFNYDMKFIETTGVEEIYLLRDLSGNNRNKTISGFELGTDYIMFDGLYDYMKFDYLESNYRTYEITISPAAIGNQQFIFGNWDSEGGGGITLQANGKIRGGFYIGNEAVIVTSKTTLAANKKYFIALTYDGYMVRLYINGHLESYARKAGVIAPTDDVFVSMGVGLPFGGAPEMLCDTPCGEYFYGKVYSAALHDVALSAEDIAIDANTTGVYLEKETYLEGVFSDWTLASSTTLNSNILTLSTTSGAVSNYYDVNGGFWYATFDVYSDNTASSCNAQAGVNYSSAYYDSDYNSVAALTGDTTNGWGICYPTSVWKDGILWNGYNSKLSTRGIMYPRYGSNVKYVKITFNANNSWGSNPTLIRNFKLYGEKLKSTFYYINVKTTENIGVDVVKYAKGSKNKTYFQTGGTTVNGYQIRVIENGTYTVYVKDLNGNEIVKTIDITDII